MLLLISNSPRTIDIVFFVIMLAQCAAVIILDNRVTQLRMVFTSLLPPMCQRSLLVCCQRCPATWKPQSRDTCHTEGKLLCIILRNKVIATFWLSINLDLCQSLNNLISQEVAAVSFDQEINNGGKRVWTNIPAQPPRPSLLLLKTPIHGYLPYWGKVK